jgi:hypothetical protein
VHLHADDDRAGTARGIRPGLDKELLALIQATAEVEIATNGGSTTNS